MMDLTKLADELDATAGNNSDMYEHERDSCREAARILRAAAAVDVAGLMELAEAMANAAYASAVDYINGAGADATKEVEARSALESALRMALAAREGFVMVPVEPTREMLNAAIDVDSFKLGDISPIGFRCSPQQLFERCYAAMIAAAPKGTP